MNPKHVLDFVNSEIGPRQIKCDKITTEYNKLMEEYKALSAFKRFFKSSPDRDWWDFGEYHLQELKEIKRKAEYKTKMEYEIMDIPARWHDRFYKWAEENKIPF